MEIGINPRHGQPDHACMVYPYETPTFFAAQFAVGCHGGWEGGFKLEKHAKEALEWHESTCKYKYCSS